MRNVEHGRQHSAYLMVMQPAYPFGMDGESIRRARRRKRLLQLLAEVGGPAQAARDVGTPKSYFSAITAGKRGLGDPLAARLEQEYDKPAGWFDQADGAYWPFSIELQDEVSNLDPEDMEHLEHSIWGFLRKKVPDELHYPEHQSSQAAPSKPAAVKLNTPPAVSGLGKDRHLPKR